MAGHSHRSSVKNGHKAFKSRHSSKNALKRANKGKVERESIGTGRPIKNASKLQRRNKAKQLRAQKILDTLQIRKLFEGSNGAEKIITVIPLTEDVDAHDIITKILSSADLDEQTLSQFVPQGMPNSAFVKDIHIKKFKSNLKFIVPDMSNFLNILDASKVADFTIFGLSGTSEVDSEFGEQVIRALELQGIASYIGVVSNLSQVHPKEKFQLDVKQSLESYFKHFFPNEDKIYNLEKPSDSLIALRTLCQKFPRGVTWRDSRGYMVANNIDFIDSETQPDVGDLVISGTVRGCGFNSDRLIHIPGLGDFQVNKIERIAASTRKTKKDADELDEISSLLENSFAATSEQDTLDEFAPVDMEFEDMSDEDEFEYSNLKAARYDDHGFLPGREQQSKKYKIPKGTSEYQAKWYLEDVVEVDDDEELEPDHEETAMDDMDMDEAVDEYAHEGFNDEMEDDFTDAKTTTEDLFVELSPEEEERQLREYRALEKEDREFPDEIELEPTQSAIEALKYYRGLKNLYNCVWDVEERDPRTPQEWNRLLRIGNYKNTKNRLQKEAVKTAQVVAGDRIKLHINFPKNLLSKVNDPSIISFPVYGLLRHEHKNAMVNFSIQRWEEYEDPVPSKETLLVQYGARRYAIQPLFSGDANSSNNVHKYDRFLHPETASVATCIAPVDFTQSPAIFFKPSSTDRKGIELVGLGTFMNADHTRVLAKRAILTGHPFRFHKKVVTVRYMFFRPEDVEWFKSIPLFTKTGRSGFIKESLGTHGYFKATFDGKLSAQDVVAMSLYKRMWPRPSIPWNGESIEEIQD